MDIQKIASIFKDILDIATKAADILATNVLTEEFNRRSEVLVKKMGEKAEALLQIVVQLNSAEKENFNNVIKTGLILVHEISQQIDAAKSYVFEEAQDRLDQLNNNIQENKKSLLSKIDLNNNMVKDYLYQIIRINSPLKR